ncbi:MAG: tRNA preQ1(34) S-adenosylmethionine ribosyltransferase-isomerase QueA [Dehalococcoidia bacterium]|nr:tRNA preQ1(34) S-adenosylmethionine ribosyltransferase-isomerase QueA [Dehalococcoidia bacterium]
MRTSDFDYFLPEERIAQTPAEPRDSSRLLVLDRHKPGVHIEHRKFRDLTDYLRPGDLMVFNRSRVIPARLHGTETRSGARVEILLVRRQAPGVWQALGRPGRRLRVGTTVSLGNEGEPVPTARVEVLETQDNGLRMVRLSDETVLEGLGELPLPPYIKETPTDPERYQTVYADAPGSVAAPTAGLHFTDELLEEIRGLGITTAWVTLHVGLDTFRPVRGEDIAEHKIHTEWYELPEETANLVNAARREGRRIIAVGTTTVRTLEQVGRDAHQQGVKEITATAGDADLFIVPGHQFRLVDVMLTNFHLPRSTLLMLVSAFAGRERILAAYEEAVRQEYRFYSFGDAMLLL